MSFLPICKQDMIDRGWQQCDFVYVIGDAYVDHHSFGHAIISRILESHGYSVGIISQPNWKDPKSIIFTAVPGWAFWSVAAIWIPWSTIIPSPSTAARPMLSPPAAKWASGPIMPRWFTAI